MAVFRIAFAERERPIDKIMHLDALVARPHTIDFVFVVDGCMRSISVIEKPWYCKIDWIGRKRGREYRKVRDHKQFENEFIGKLIYRSRLA